MRSWRLVDDIHAGGSFQMALDAVLLDAAVGGSAPVLRFYTWSGPWLSLGYGQAVPAELLRDCESAGVGVVRRLTGGRAVLHGADLTYALVAPAGVLPDGIAESCAWIADALVAGLRAVGIDAGRAPRARDSGPRGPFDCFAAAAGDELVVAGRKLVGSAQRRTSGAVLQHGSIRLADDPPEVLRATGLQGSGSTSLAACGYRGGGGPLRAALVDAFAERFGGRLAPGPLAPEERARALAGAQALVEGRESASQPASRVPGDRR